MKFKTNIITIYYVVAVSILGLQAIQTVYQLSQSIGFGQKIAHLQQQKEVLTNQQMDISRQISQASSLTQLGGNIEENFTPITVPILVSANTSVASR